ncbi:hypothetical protein CPC08DRAFT_751287 [Agrocybe pediades]|nr:hypothetical protein CPC08DRAFT_751287 [Agrocybe pediades]
MPGMDYQTPSQLDRRQLQHHDIEQANRLNSIWASIWSAAAAEREEALGYNGVDGHWVGCSTTYTFHLCIRLSRFINDGTSSSYFLKIPRSQPPSPMTTSPSTILKWLHRFTPTHPPRLLPPGSQAFPFSSISDFDVEAKWYTNTYHGDDDSNSRYKDRLRRRHVVSYDAGMATSTPLCSLPKKRLFACTCVALKHNMSISDSSGREEDEAEIPATTSYTATGRHTLEFSLALSDVFDTDDDLGNRDIRNSSSFHAKLQIPAQVYIRSAPGSQNAHRDSGLAASNHSCFALVLVKRWSSEPASVVRTAKGDEEMVSGPKEGGKVPNRDVVDTASSSVPNADQTMKEEPGPTL